MKIKYYNGDINILNKLEDNEISYYEKEQLQDGARTLNLLGNIKTNINEYGESINNFNESINESNEDETVIINGTEYIRKR